MLSIHDFGNLGAAGAGAAGAEQYYQQTTSADRESHGLAAAPEGQSEGITYAFGERAPADLREGQRLAREDVRDLLRGEWRGQAVQNAHAERRFMGWDAAFSCPKSLSVAYAVADPETRQRIEDAALAAARRAVDDILRREMYARVGHGGRERIEVSPVATLYLQTLSRANDPQLHVHVVVPSYAWGKDGRVHTIEFGEVYRSKQAIGEGFRVELARKVEQRTGLRMYCGAAGEVRIDGISPALEQLYSKRTEQIEQRLGLDAYTATAAQRAAATVASRPAHDRDYREDWAEQARAAGRERDWQAAVSAVQQALERQRAGEVELSAEERRRLVDRAVDEARRVVTFGGTSAVTGEKFPGSAVVEYHRVLAETAARAVGTGASLDDVLAAVERAVERGQIVSLERGDTPLSERVTTPEMITLERRLISDWRTLLERETHAVAPEHVAQAVREWEQAHPGQRLSSEQVAAVGAVTSARDVALIEGLAGTGKTASLDAARRAWELAGYTVVGESYGGMPASELQRATGIPARTIALAEVTERTLTSRTVIVVDEAARATSPQLAALVAEAREAGAKIVLVGDPRQLQPMGPNAFPHLARAVIERAPEASTQIQEIRRQQNAPPEVRKVAELAARGRAGDALRRADEAGLVRVHGTTDGMRRAAAGEIADALQRGTALGLTATRLDAQRLNAAVRQELRDRGALSAEERAYTVTKMRQTLSVALAEGDRVSFKHNSYDLGVRNGWQGTVTGIHPRRGDVCVRLHDQVRLDRDGQVMRGTVLEVRLDGRLQVHGNRGTEQRHVYVPAEKVARVLDLDYARTVDRAHGSTTDRSVVSVHADSRRMDRQWGAVAFTRQREGLSVHLSAEGMERPEQRQVTYEQAHWPRPGLSGQEPHQNAIRAARAARDEARQAMQEARQTWHQARDDLRQARRDLRDARAAGDAERVAAAKESVAAKRGAERAAHADYQDAKERCREAREHARETWAEAKAAARGQAEERERTRPGSAVQEQQPVSRETKAEAVQTAAKQLDRDRPGSSTLDYQHSQERQTARGTDRQENILGERAVLRAGREHGGLGHAR